MPRVEGKGEKREEPGALEDRRSTAGTERALPFAKASGRGRRARRVTAARIRKERHQQNKCVCVCVGSEAVCCAFQKMLMTTLRNLLQRAQKVQSNL